MVLSIIRIKLLHGWQPSHFIANYPAAMSCRQAIALSVAKEGL